VNPAGLEDMELSIASVRMKLPTLYASGRALPAGRLHRHQPDGAEPERIDALCNQRANSGSKKAKGATYPTFAVNGVRLQLHVLEQAEGQFEATPSSDQCEPPRSRACWMDGVERLPIITAIRRRSSAKSAPSKWLGVKKASDSRLVPRSNARLRHRGG
jgi:hypothetical protein